MLLEPGHVKQNGHGCIFQEKFSSFACNISLLKSCIQIWKFSYSIYYYVFHILILNHIQLMMETNLQHDYYVFHMAQKWSKTLSLLWINVYCPTFGQIMAPGHVTKISHYFLQTNASRLWESNLCESF